MHAKTTANSFLWPALLATLAACSPALNWRSVALGDAPLTVLLPCKPDRAVRALDWGAGQRSISMVGCKADGATYAVSHMLLAQASEAPVVLERWQQALQKQLQANDVDAVMKPFLMHGSLVLAPSRQVQWQGKGAQGETVVADALWFAQLEGQQVRVYQALVLSPDKPVAQTALDSFVQGLQWR